MRPDFYRVVTERPRQGSRNRNRKTHFRVHDVDACFQDALDSMPHSEKMVRYFRGPKGDGYKDFSDVLGPIKGFLFKRVGDKWDDIYSEIRQALPANSPEPVRHIYEVHIKGQVEQNCISDVNGRIWESDGRRIVDRFYVHPATRTLEYIEPESYRTRYRKSIKRVIGNNVPLLRPKPDWKDVIDDLDVGRGWSVKYTVCKPNDTTRVVKINGIWYIYGYRIRKPHERVRVSFDAWMHRHEEHLPRLEQIVHKQANRRELKLYGLRNDTPRFAIITTPRLVTNQRGSFLSLCALYACS